MIATFSQNFSGTVDANGNITIPISGLFTNYWSMVMVTTQHVQNFNGVLKPVGRPTWNLQVAQDVLDIQSGASVHLGPRPVPPGSTITISLINGIPGAFVNGVLHGTYSVNPSEILTGSYIPQSNAPSITVTGPASNALVSNQPLGATSSLNLPALAPATTYLLLTMQPNGGTNIEIIGLDITPSIIYYNETFPNGAIGTIIRAVPVTPALDQHLRILNNGPSALNELTIEARSDAIPDVLVAPGFGISLNSPSIAQAPRLFKSSTQNSTGTFVIDTPSANQQLYVYGWTLTADGITAGGVRTRLAAHGVTNGNIGILSAQISSSSSGGISGYHGGVPLGFGVGLDFIVDFLPASDTALAAVSYSIG